MGTETLHIQEFFTALDEVSSEILQLISFADVRTINIVPFKNSWTAAQLVSHVTKSNKAIVQALKMEGKLSRNKTWVKEYRS